MHLEPAFTIDIQVGVMTDIGATPRGRRRYIGAASGNIRGERVDGRLLQGGDWVLETPDGFAHADIRYVFETADGAFLYIQGSGLMEMNAAFGRALSGQAETRAGDHYIRTDFVVETGDEQYAWMNTTMFVAETTFSPGLSLHYAVASLA
ncbi:hypothetical protein DEI92_01025 [Curtobacterium sp. MCBD17_034]|uniref:DUF3237 domain-containing protein n=1 Tax=unclassified Curtobacterium TaxID=257496 RepID=UPI000DAA0E78|nr:MULTISPECIES: DUF3237 domain-containing protein [unclassified Curtobacterium]PZF62125.1 hypothetical protein DEI92_01025 [Curtobacterium sp. MCBD17_034]PZM33940.1 hypothetical protein DEI90_09675 [Curtobacterium sp. MCBD17_031]